MEGERSPFAFPPGSFQSLSYSNDAQVPSGGVVFTALSAPPAAPAMANAAHRNHDPGLGNRPWYIQGAQRDGWP